MHNVISVPWMYIVIKEIILFTNEVIIIAIGMVEYRYVYVIQTLHTDCRPY